MSTCTYASFRSTPDASKFTISATSGGSLSGSGTIYLSIQTRNRYGLSLHTTPTSISYTSGQRIAITIASNAFANGEDIREVWISGASSNSTSAMKLLAIWRRRNAITIGSSDYPGEGTAKTLPTTIYLSTNAQIALSSSVANPTALPSSGLIDGMVRSIVSTAEVVRYDSEASDGLYPASIGYWVEHNRGFSSGDDFSTYFGTATDIEGGSDYPIVSVASDAPVLSPPSYTPDGSIQTIGLDLWLNNGLTADGSPDKASGTGVAAFVYRNGVNESVVFASKLIAVLNGYVDRSTGVLDTDMDGIGSDRVLYSSGDGTDSDVFRLEGLTLPKDLPRGSAAWYTIKLRVDTSELNGRILEGDRISIILQERSLVGTPASALHAVVGDVVLPDDAGDRLRIVPDLSAIRRLGGIGLIQGYSTPLLGEAVFSGLEPDEPDQQVAISGALGGDCVIRLSSETLLDSESLRATVGTEPGEYTASSYTTGISISGATQALQVTVNYPCDADGFGTIRSNYPDAKIAGSSRGKFNVPRLRLYLYNGTTITRLDQEIVVVPGVSQTFTITSITGTVVGSLPTAAFTDFCLFGYGSISRSVVTSASNFVSGTYQLAISYYYPSPNSQVTAIDHGAVGVISEFQQSLAEASQEFVPDEAALIGYSTFFA